MKKIILSACLLVLLAGCSNQQSTEQKIQNQIDKTQETSKAKSNNEWQKFNYSKGVSVSMPSGWRNMGPEDEPIFTDSEEKVQIHVSFHGDEQAFDSTGKQVIENMLASAKDKDAKITENQVLEWKKETLNLGENTIYKVYRPENEKDASFYIRLKNNAGFVEFYVAEHGNEAIIKDILKTIEIN